MQPILSEIIGTLIQIVLFALVPFLIFLFRKDKTSNFLTYVGLYRPTQKSINYSVVASLIFLISGIGMVMFDQGMREVMLHPSTVTGKLNQMGLNISTVLILLIIAFFKTSLAEEILFRGFLAKKLIQKLGFRYGNIFQAFIFGSVHILLLKALIETTVLAFAYTFFISTFAGWVLGYIKVKYANGSIVPGWIAHGLGNTLSYFVIAFII